jgi:hypothetical protein
VQGAAVLPREVAVVLGAHAALLAIDPAFLPLNMRSLSGGKLPSLNAPADAVLLIFFAVIDAVRGLGEKRGGCEGERGSECNVRQFHGEGSWVSTSFLRRLGSCCRRVRRSEPGGSRESFPRLCQEVRVTVGTQGWNRLKRDWWSNNWQTADFPQSIHSFSTAPQLPDALWIAILDWLRGMTDVLVMSIESSDGSQV